MTNTHVAISVVVWSLEIGTLVHIVVGPLLLAEMVGHRCHLPTSTNRVVHSKIVHGARPVLLALGLELESWLQQESEEIDEVLRTVQPRDLGLSLLVLLAILSLLVEDLLISDLPHLLGIAVLNIESIIALEENILGELLGLLALVLLVEVDESLLGPWHNLDL